MPSSGVQSPEQAEPIVGAPAKLECGVGCHRELIWPHSGRKGSPCPSLQAGSAVGALGLVQPVPLTVLSASCWGLPVSGWLWWKCFSVGPSGDHWQQCKASTGPLGSAPPRVSPSHLRLGPGKHEVRVRKNPDGVFSSLGEVTECGGRGWGGGRSQLSLQAGQGHLQPDLRFEWLSAGPALGSAPAGAQAGRVVSGGSGPGQG